MNSKATHRLDLSKKVLRGKHVTNRTVTIQAQIDIDGDFFTSVPIPFCKVDKIVPQEDEYVPFYINDIASLIEAGFEEIKITSLPK
jgi:hypothetical protein